MSYSSSKPNTNISNVIEDQANIYNDFKLLGKLILHHID